MKLLFIFFLSVSLQAAQYFVETDGNDSNTGLDNTPSGAWLTVGKGAATAVAGDTVTIGAGTFTERITLPNSGVVGSPIIFQGTMSGTNHLTSINGGKLITGWVQDFEVESNLFVWRTARALNLASVTVDGVKSLRMNELEDYTGSLAAQNTYLRSSSNFQFAIDQTPGQFLVWWDNHTAITGWWAGQLYFRHKTPGVDPNTLTISGNDYGDSTFFANNKSYITIRNLHVNQGYEPITLDNGSNNIIVDGCHLQNGHARVRMLNGAHSNTINDCVMNTTWPMEIRGWSSGDLNSLVQQHIYRLGKSFQGDQIQNWDWGLSCFTAGSNNTLSNNRIKSILSCFEQWTTLADITGLRIFGNTFEGDCGTTIYFGRGTQDVEVHDNLFFNSIFAFRIGDLELGNIGPIYVYNNRFWNNNPVIDSFVYFFAETLAVPSDPLEMYWYHNSFDVTEASLRASGFVPNIGDTPDVHFINNIFSTQSLATDNGGGWATGSGSVGVFGYNWVGGSFSSVWFDEGNIGDPGADIWPLTSQPNFILPLGHAAASSAIDLSTNPTVGGRLFSNLPGMVPGYYLPGTLDMGVFAGGVSPCVTLP